MKRLLFSLLLCCATVADTNYIGNWVGTNTASGTLGATQRLIVASNSVAYATTLATLGSYLFASPTITGNLTLSGLTGLSTNLYNLQQQVKVDASGNITAPSFISTGSGATAMDSADVTNSFKLRNATASRFAVFDGESNLTNDVAATGTGAPVRATAPTFTGATVNDTLAFEQAVNAVYVANSTNFVADFTAAPYQLVSAATTNHVNFIHATNVAAGRWCVMLIDPTTNDWCRLSIPATWFQRGLTSQAIIVTNYTMGILSLYGYGAENTNVIATYSYVTK